MKAKKVKIKINKEERTGMGKINKQNCILCGKEVTPFCSECIEEHIQASIKQSNQEKVKDIIGIIKEKTS